MLDLNVVRVCKIHLVIWFLFVPYIHNLIEDWNRKHKQVVRKNGSFILE